MIVKARHRPPPPPPLRPRLCVLERCSTMPPLHFWLYPVGSILVFLRGDNLVRVLHHEFICRGDVRGVFVLQEHGQRGEAHLAGGKAVARLRKALGSGVWAHSILCTVSGV